MNEAPVRAFGQIVSRELAYRTPNAWYASLDLPFIRRRKAPQSKEPVRQVKALPDS